MSDSSNESPKARSEQRPSVESQPQSQPQPQRKASGRGRSRSNRRSPSVSTVSDDGPEEIPANEDKRRKRKNKKRQNPLPAVDEAESTGREVAETGGGAVQKSGDSGGAAAQEDKPSGGGDKPLKLRLDLNLDADIRLTAKVHGDVTLSLL
ncbi:hypothetical protein AGABI2DRAFT_181760 [Agaricus bisporus var. bisporus H97]|uniref:hypothetical protein n=1 Tax=Agaricus bisporus var. bisporus (strain H97 / ATCC MYA-4626 / FGSC 10389) TaxID=936046 RepID=UPI00029F5BB5|nr:hypothetical protein AGABI2DRAFT_181760 [Agaricus bisporus var. bisporus H97]EKV41750.1 hypothetical protein AGABI2DRAFT_181760 [Agaricus bisporus var. bisporus H97]